MNCLPLSIEPSLHLCGSRTVEFIITEEIEAAPPGEAVLSAFLVQEKQLGMRSVLWVCEVTQIPGIGYWCLSRMYAAARGRFDSLRRGIAGHFEGE